MNEERLPLIRFLPPLGLKMIVLPKPPPSLCIYYLAIVPLMLEPVLKSKELKMPIDPGQGPLVYYFRVVYAQGYER